MDIVRENKGQLEAVITIRLTEEDYRGQVEKELKNMQRKVQMPGFRPGKVPIGLVKKMYGKSVLAEEVNKVLADALTNYIKENGMNVLGNPLPDHEKAASVDWEDQGEFEFDYRIGLAPEIDLELSENIEVDYHRIRVGDEMVDNYVKDFQKRFGKITNPGQAADEDVLFGEFQEMENESTTREDGQVHKANLYIKFLKDEDLKQQLIGARPGAHFVMDIKKAVDSEAEAAAMVGVKKEELGKYSPLFRFTLESISRVEPAEINQELFEKALPGKGIATEEDFRAQLAEQVARQYQVDADKHFKNLVMQKLIAEADLPLPVDFLKKWLLDTNKDQLTEEKVDKEFEQFADSFRWQLIENHLIRKYELEVAPAEVNQELESFVRSQLKQYGQHEVEQNMIDEYVKQVATNKEEVKKVYDHLFEKKLMELFREKLKLKEVEIGFDDFVKLVTEKYKQDQAQPAPGTDT